MKAVIITTGDPAGCGPFITFNAIDTLRKLPLEFFVIGDKALAEGIPAYHRVKQRITFIDAATPGINRLKKGFASRLS
ncbi:MAG: hypothetical protein PHV55_05000, partial [Candidatus Omnitrophica bacterium]|nr:hypothetical protein [Candidatus Omnitrophota bacterium]